MRLSYQPLIIVAAARVRCKSAAVSAHQLLQAARKRLNQVSLSV